MSKLTNSSVLSCCNVVSVFRLHLPRGHGRDRGGLRGRGRGQLQLQHQRRRQVRQEHAVPGQLHHGRLLQEDEVLLQPLQTRQGRLPVRPEREWQAEKVSLNYPKKHFFSKF